jgi:hypothetical protein
MNIVFTFIVGVWISFLPSVSELMLLLKQQIVLFFFFQMVQQISPFLQVSFEFINCLLEYETLEGMEFEVQSF